MASDPSRRLQDAWLTRGALARALWPLSLLFGLVSRIRRALYSLGFVRAGVLPVPVIVVGNLIAGGAGKTPSVIAIVALLSRAGYAPGVISRGYGRRHGDEAAPLEVEPRSAAIDVGDEPLLIRRRTQVPVAVGRHRVAAARWLLARHPALDVLVSDDGLQHLRLPRDAQVLVFDERGVGNGWLLPAGPLREPLPEQVPPRSLVLYNAEQASTRLAGELARRRIAGIAPLAEWHAGAAASLEALDVLHGAGRPIVAAAGMARPQRFFSMLREAGLAIVECPLPDHHDFATLPWPTDTPDVIVTEKDAVKLQPERAGATRVWVATLDFTLTPSFEASLLAMLPAPRAPQAR